MATGAEGLLHCVFDGCIAGSCLNVEHRPYHRNCTCALHHLNAGAKACPRKMVAYPVRRQRRIGALATNFTCSAIPLPVTTSSSGLDGEVGSCWGMEKCCFFHGKH